MRPIALLALLVPSLLTAQQRGYVIGVTGFTGGTWQPSGFEVGVVRPAGRSPGRSWALMVRAGSFVQDQAVLVGGSTGFFTALLGGYRRSLADLLMVGSERSPTWIRLVGTAEVGLSKNFNSPLPQGAFHASVAALLGFSFGAEERGDGSFSIMAGPAWLVGDRSTLHTQVSMRFQTATGGRRGS